MKSFAQLVELAKRPKRDRDQYQLQDLVPQYRGTLLWKDPPEYMMFPKATTDLATAIAKITKRMIDEISSGMSDADDIEWQVTDQFGKIHASSKKQQEAKRPGQHVAGQYKLMEASWEEIEELLQKQGWVQTWQDHKEDFKHSRWNLYVGPLDNRHDIGEVTLMQVPKYAKNPSVMLFYKNNRTPSAMVQGPTTQDAYDILDQLKTSGTEWFRQLAVDVGEDPDEYIDEAKRPSTDPEQFKLFRDSTTLDPEEDPAVGNYEVRLYYDREGAQVGPDGEEWMDYPEVFDNFDNAVTVAWEQENYAEDNYPNAFSEVLFQCPALDVSLWLGSIQMEV